MRVVARPARERVGCPGAGQGEGAGNEVRRGDSHPRRQIDAQHEIRRAEHAIPVGVQHQPAAAAIARRGGGKPMEEPGGAARRVRQGEPGRRRSGRGEGAAEADRQQWPAAARRREGSGGNGIQRRARRLPTQHQQIARRSIEIGDAVGRRKGGAERCRAGFEQHEAIRPGTARQHIRAKAAEQPVRPVAARQGVGTGTTLERVGPPAAGEAVVAGRAHQPVITAAGEQGEVLDAGEHRAGHPPDLPGQRA